MHIFLDKLRSVDELLSEADRPKIPSLKVEMIDIQKNDVVIANVEALAVELFSLCKSERISNSVDGFKVPSIRHILDKMEVMLANRFGFPNLVFAPSDYFGSYTIAGRHVNNTVAEDMTMLVDCLKSTTSFIKETDTYTDYNDPAITLDNPEILEQRDSLPEVTEYAILQSVLESINSISKELNSRGIIIDRQNAVIKNLPKDVKIIINIDISNPNMTAQLFMAVLLHEIGHSFNNLLYSSRFVNNTAVLVDTFLDNVRRRNKSPKESFLIAYRRAFDDQEIEKYKDKNIISLCIYALTTSNAYLMSSLTPSQVHNVNDSESLADQFAGKFGYGHIIAEHLAIETLQWRRDSMIGGIALTFCMAIFIIITIFVPILWLMAIPFIIGWFIHMIGFTNHVLFDPGEFQFTGYDDFPRRIKRIRNEIVRQIRESKNDKEFTNLLLNRLKAIDTLTSLESDNKFRSLFTKLKSPIAKILDMTIGWRKSAINIKRIEQIQEDLNANELHVVSAKLSQLKGV